LTAAIRRPTSSDLALGAVHSYAEFLLVTAELFETGRLAEVAEMYTHLAASASAVERRLVGLALSGNAQAVQALQQFRVAFPSPAN